MVILENEVGRVSYRDDTWIVTEYHPMANLVAFTTSPVVAAECWNEITGAHETFGWLETLRLASEV